MEEIIIPIKNKITEFKEAGKKTNYGKKLYLSFLTSSFLPLLQNKAFAAEDIFSKANEIMHDVYSQILGISTVAAVVSASIALLLMNFSKSGRTVDESRSWLKRILITWAILNGLGFIMAYITPFFQGGAWS